MDNSKLWIVIVVLSIIGAIATFNHYGFIETGGSSRVEELNAMPSLYRSQILPASSDLPDHLSVFGDVVSSLVLQTKTEHYIPKEALAQTQRMIDALDLDATATVKVGDVVDVLDIQKSKANETFGLIRTRHNTYGWIADWHLKDKYGQRLNTFRGR